jgi:hypothetical protein
MIEVYKISKQIYDPRTTINLSYLNTNPTQGNEKKILKKRPRLDLEKK